MSDKRIGPILRCKPRSRVPGDTARVLTAPATDVNGRVFPKGTVYQPLHGGMNNVTGRYELVVSVINAGRPES